MMVFIVVESIMIAGVTLYQFNNQNSEYHEGRLERKEKNLLTDLKYEIDKSGINSIDALSNSMVLEVADVHNLEFELYSLEGILLKSSTAVTGVRGTTIIDQQIVDYFKQANPIRYVEDDKNSSYFKSSYNLVSSFNNEPLGIIYIPYFADDTVAKKSYGIFDKTWVCSWKYDFNCICNCIFYFKFCNKVFRFDRRNY